MAIANEGRAALNELMKRTDALTIPPTLSIKHMVDGTRRLIVGFDAKFEAILLLIELGRQYPDRIIPKKTATPEKQGPNELGIDLNKLAFDLENIAKFDKRKFLVEQDGESELDLRLMERDDWDAVRELECDLEGCILDIQVFDQDRARQALMKLREVAKLRA